MSSLLGLSPPSRQADLPLPESTAKKPLRMMEDLAPPGASQIIVNEDGGATFGTGKIFGGSRGDDGRWRGGRWLVTISGTARTMLKRWIRGMKEEAGHGDLSVTRTREIDDALRVFEMRYPLRMSSEDRHAMREGAEEAAEAERLSRRIMRPDYVATDYPLVGVVPYPFQRAGADALRASRALLCADDLGLGKTILALCTLCDGALRPALVICPANLIPQWVGELKRCLPQLRVHVLKGTTPTDIPEEWYKQAKRAHNAEQRTSGKRPAPFPYSGPMWPDVLVTNYHRLEGWAPAIVGKIRYVIADEVHELRHSDSGKYRAFRVIRADADACLGLSATPIFNYGGEARTVLDAIAPGALGTESEFASAYCNGSRANAVSDPRALHEDLVGRGLMVRRRRYEVGHELPELTKSRVPVSDDDRRFAKEAQAGGAMELARFIVANSGAENPELRRRAFSSGGQFERVLRQATGVAKANQIADLIIMCAEQRQRPVVFCHHRAVWRIIAERLNAANISFASYTGEETDRQKAESLAAFCRADGVDVFLVGLHSGSIGLDGLQHWSSTGIIGELDYTNARHEQAIARLQRNGQKQPVIFYMVIADFGWDPIAVDIVNVKGAQSEGIFDPGGRADAANVDMSRVRKLAETYLAAVSKKHPEGAAAKAKPYVHPG